MSEEKKSGIENEEYKGPSEFWNSIDKSASHATIAGLAGAAIGAATAAYLSRQAPSKLSENIQKGVSIGSGVGGLLGTVEGGWTGVVQARKAREQHEDLKAELKDTKRENGYRQMIMEQVRDKSKKENER